MSICGKSRTFALGNFSARHIKTNAIMEFKEKMKTTADMMRAAVNQAEVAICEFMTEKGKTLWNLSDRTDKKKGQLRTGIFTTQSYMYEDVQGVRALALRMVETEGGKHIEVLVATSEYDGKHTARELRKHFDNWEFEMEDEGTTYVVTDFTDWRGCCENNMELQYNIMRYVGEYIATL